MTGDGWAEAGGIDPDTLVEATLQLHWAVQFVASAGQTFVEPRDDDSHRAMTWHEGVRAFVGHPFPGAYPFRVAVRPEDLALLILDRTDQAVGTLELGGRTRDEGYEWLGVGMATYMGGAPPIIERPEYDLPAHPVGDGAPFSTALRDPLRALSTLYGSAAAAIRDLVEGRDDASIIRCWPHHFDLASLLTVEEDAGGTATKTVGVGLAPMGGGYESWYLYVTPWPYPRGVDLPPLGGPGSWHTQGWTGAILTGTEVGAMDPARRASGVRDFFESALAAATRSLGG